VDAAAAEIRAGGGKASGVAVDVRDPERVQQMVAEVKGAHGRLDLLVNNAAGNFYAPSESLSANAWKSVVEIDLYGTFFCSQAVLPVMREGGGGSIVNISMTLHYRGWPLMAHATAAKAGIDALTRTLALEWARDRVRVNAIAPGPIPTEAGDPAPAVGDSGRYRQHGCLPRLPGGGVDHGRDHGRRRRGVAGQTAAAALKLTGPFDRQLRSPAVR
jgi:peroxisomal 2,4-dienoyl-CoA reductase